MPLQWAPPDTDPVTDALHQPALINGSPAVKRKDKATPSVLQKLQKWGDYEACGDVVKPSLFIPMKTPFSKAILSEWSLPEQPKHSLSVASLLQRQHFHQRQIGMIIDLSNHETLYADDIPPFVQYQHIQLVAKVFPDQCQVDEVIEIAEKYWADNPAKFIAIHCAYGFNRTGFVVCSYLIQALGMSVNEALAAFEEARPPGVKHEKFRAELHRRFDSHRWGSGHSTVGSDAASISGFSQARSSHSGSVSSLHSDFKGVAEHLHGRRFPKSRPVSLDMWPGRPPVARSQAGSMDSNAAPATVSPARSASDAAAGLATLSPMSFGSENESLGLNQRAALRELRRTSISSSRYEEGNELAPNPSLGMGVSELTAALRQHRPRRDITTLPVVQSSQSLIDGDAVPGTSVTSSSPGIISPFAALSHSPHEHSDVALSESLEPAETSNAEQHATEGAYEVAAEQFANANQQGAASSAAEQLAGAWQHEAVARGDVHAAQPELSFSQQGAALQQNCTAQAADANIEAEFDSAGSDGTQQQRPKTRPVNCALM